jgi:phosphoglycolate phosphatase-like HAD superfamily hydrolase
LRAVCLLVVAGAACDRAIGAQGAGDPLPSWNDTPAKRAILELVKTATDKKSAQFVPVEDRIATFDQDGTLWVEHPLYTQAEFALARLRDLASSHAEWKKEEPFKSFLTGDAEKLGKLAESDWEKLIAVTHGDVTVSDFIALARKWLDTAEHPRFSRRYTELVYQPMLEVMRFLRANGFKTYIATGGGQEFVRAYSQSVYEIPVEQVIGSSVLTKYSAEGGTPALHREPKPFFINDHDGKPVGINLFIGKRPIAAFGNSSGDVAMLQWTGAGKGPHLMMLVLHDDAEREYAYGPAAGLPDTKVGTFPQSVMDGAKKAGWSIISMKNDWKRIFQ